MRYRWDPAYPMGRRDTQPYDASLRASDDERNAVADKLSRHYAEGRLDETEFKNRLDTAMSATTRGDLNGLFDDLPRLTSQAPPPPPRHRRMLPWLIVVAFVAIAAGASMPFFPLYHVPWLLFAVVGLILWRRAGGHTCTHTIITTTTRGVPAPSRTTEGVAVRTNAHPSAGTDGEMGTLRSIVLFAGLPDSEIQELEARCTVSTAHPGQVVQAQDVPVRMWHVITAGHAVVQRDGMAIGLLGRGDSWSEHSLLNQLPSSIAVVALSPLTLLTMGRRDFFGIPDHHPVLAGRLVARSATSADRLALPVFNVLAHPADTHCTGGPREGRYD